MASGADGRLTVEVDALSEGKPQGLAAKQVQALLDQLQEDAQAVTALAIAAKQEREPRYRVPRMVNVSLVLCDDLYIQGMNARHRGKDTPTDVLSFEMPDDEDAPVNLPVKLLGDVIISLDTAARQAAERSHSLVDEARILLVHGVLHLTGMDHERGPEEAAAMAAAEAAIMRAMGWKGAGLIEAVGGADLHPDPPSGSSSSHSSGGGASSSSSSSVSSDSRQASGATASTSRQDDGASSLLVARAGDRYTDSGVEIVCIDMDGTLLNSRSRISPAVAKAVKAACQAGVRVVLATGKARPAAMAACREAGIAGEGLAIWPKGPGVFLQGLAVHGLGGRQLSDAVLPPAVVRQAFQYSLDTGVSCVAFLGDECATLRMTPELEELHTRYYEPLAGVQPSLEALLGGPPVRKLLFMAPPSQVDAVLKPHWTKQLVGSGASPMQAVPDMLELVPQGVNKWAGIEVLLQHLGADPGALMAIGDGSNDLEMVAGAGIGVAMGNAVPAVKAAASVVVGSNDDDGVAEALERYVL